MPTIVKTGGNNEKPISFNAQICIGLNSPLIDRSTTITAGGTAQVVTVANDNRQYLFFQNVSDAVMWLGLGTVDAVAGPGSILVPANGGCFFWENNETPPDRVTVFCATTGKGFTCKEA